MSLLTYEWLKDNGWHKLERLERQPTDHYRRCLGTETIGDHFMSAPEDVCLDVCADREVDSKFWYVWLTRASTQNRHPSVWVHVRHIKSTEELTTMYEAITGRKFTRGQVWANSQWSKLGEPLFEPAKI